jgi:DNA-binding protein HU-beta
MNKARLIETIAAHTGINKKIVDDLLQGFEKVVMEALKSGDEVTLTGFGTFSARRREARMGVNPQKPSERMQIPAVTVPKFKAGKTLKDFLKA